MGARARPPPLGPGALSQQERVREMVRPYAVKGRKKKRKLEEASASHAARPAEEAEELPPPEVGSEEDEAVTGKQEHAAADGLPILPRMVDGKRQPGAIFVLERACLEVGKVGKVQWFGCSKKLLFFSCAIFLFQNEFVSSSVGCLCPVQFNRVLSFGGFIGAVDLLMRWF